MFNDGNVVLALQVEPKLWAIAEVATEADGGVGDDAALGVENAGEAAQGTPKSNVSRFALKERVSIS